MSEQEEGDYTQGRCTGVQRGAPRGSNLGNGAGRGGKRNPRPSPQLKLGALGEPVHACVRCPSEIRRPQTSSPRMTKRLAPARATHASRDARPRPHISKTRARTHIPGTGPSTGCHGEPERVSPPPLPPTPGPSPPRGLSGQPAR